MATRPDVSSSLHDLVRACSGSERSRTGKGEEPSRERSHLRCTSFPGPSLTLLRALECKLLLRLCPHPQALGKGWGEGAHACFLPQCAEWRQCPGGLGKESLGNWLLEGKAHGRVEVGTRQRDPGGLGSEQMLCPGPTHKAAHTALCGLRELQARFRPGPWLMPLPPPLTFSPHGHHLILSFFF